jgi:hypothetical protein
MKTRTLVLFLSAAGASFAIGACSSSPATETPDVEARLRNDLPNVCTADKIAACPAVEVTRCPDGQEPVIDYSSDCCAHFTCQPFCSSAQQRSCPMTPAPACPARTKLWIGTAVEDCCPAYRCEPDGSTCDPSRGDKCGCDATNVACTLALPYCGPNVMPIVVGQTADCCPVYQCPCSGTPMITDGTPPPTPPDGNYCGCTTPNCKAGEEIVCAGKDVCGGPCTCQPARGICKADSDCGADMKCDVSACRLPPMATTTADPARQQCDVAKCGPQLGLPNGMCPDGTISGPTGRCLLNADGSCGWEVLQCPPTAGCYGICVPNAPQNGCRADSDCPMGQACDVQCREWTCSVGGAGTGTATGSTTTVDPTTGQMTPPAACACDLGDNTCGCNSVGDCKGVTCVGACVPAKPTCDPMKPVVCPTFAPVCPNGQMPIPTGVDPNTCCQTYTCPVCDIRANTAPASICPAVRCACAKVVGTDPASCCPKYECGPVNADGTCA